MDTPPEPFSRYHTLAELIHSATASERGIWNAPDETALANLRLLAQGLDAVRDLLGHPLAISSGYRSPALNAAVGGVAGSQHSLGLAADFTCAAFGDPLTVAQAIVGAEIAFDQCILEYGRWVHLSFTDAPRRRALTIYGPDKGYQLGLWTADGVQVV